MTVNCVFVAQLNQLFFSHFINWSRVTCHILREKLRMKNVECLFKVSKSAWVPLFL